jgi:uncharacterized phage infection (PIP) family protein YhgE
MFLPQNMRRIQELKYHVQQVNDSADTAIIKIDSCLKHNIKLNHNLPSTREPVFNNLYPNKKKMHTIRPVNKFKCL